MNRSRARSGARIARLARATACVVAMTAATAIAQSHSGDQAANLGTLRGQVVDAETQQPLPFSNVAFYRLVPEQPEGREFGGIMGKKDGSFSRELPPGTYRVVSRDISYERGEVRDVVVEAGRVTTITLAMMGRPIETKTVKVTGARSQDKEVALLDRRRKADAISDAISAEQMSKSTDSNAAEAMERVTGVSVVEGKYVFVRGMGERYSATQVNGSSVGTPEPNKRVVPLDLFPAGSLDNVVVQKTYTPDMEGEFGGGVVSIQTKTIPAKRTVAQSLSLGRAAGVAGGGFMTYQGGRWDAFGFDDGSRKLPDEVGRIAGNRLVTGGRGGLTNEELAAIGRSFSNVWTPRSQNIGPSIAYAGVIADRATVRGRELGYLFSASLSNSFDARTREDNEYYPSTLDEDTLQAKQNYVSQEATTSVLGGLVGTLTYWLGDEHSMRLHALYTRQSDDKASISQGPNENYGVSNVRTTELSFVERGLLSIVASSECPMVWKDTKLDWNASYSRASRNEPDRRESVYEADASGSLQLSRRSQFPATRVFGASTEYDRAVKMNWYVPMTESKAFYTSFKSGFAFRDRNRNSSFRRFGFRRLNGANALDLTESPEFLLSEKHLEENRFQVLESTNPSDSYHAEQTVAATYALVEAKVSDHVRMVAGLRLEQSEINVQTKDPNPAQRQPPTLVTLQDTDILPAFNATWNITRKMNVRAAYSLTLARPELRELSPFRMYNYETNYFDEGNVDLVSSRLRNYDLRWEWYPRLQELVALSVFCKQLDRPIEKLVKTDVGGNYSLTPFNALGGEVEGIEAELRTTLAGALNLAGRPFGKQFAPRWLQHLGVGCNYSRVRSEVQIALEGADEIRKTPLNGQSTHATNVGLYFGSSRVDGAVLYKQFGRRLAFFGGFSALPDVYEIPPRGLDVTLGVNASKALRFKFYAENVLDDDVVFKQRQAIAQRYSDGRKIGLSAAYKL